jgi:hypothetical protein
MGCEHQDSYGGIVPDRIAITKVLLVLYAVGSVAVVIPLLLGVPGSGQLGGTTSGKVLCAALLALGMGAALAARDPWKNRIIIQVLIAFTALATLAIATRVLFHHEPYSVDPAWFVLPFAAAAPVLFAVFYPRGPEG